MRLRNADPSRTVEAVVTKSVNVSGQVTTTQERLVVPPASAATLGCPAQPNPAGGRPLSITDWTIVSSRYR